MDKRLISILIIILLVVLTSTATTMQPTEAADAIAQQTCTPYDNGANGNAGAIVLGTNSATGTVLELQNVNVNNPSAKDCIYTYASGAYGWNFTTPNTSNAPNYPAQIDVRMYGTQIAGLQTAEIDTSGITANMPPGNYPWDLSWDVYLYDAAGTLTDEMMIWMLWSSFTCSGSSCNVAYPSGSSYDFGTELPAIYQAGSSFSDGYNTYSMYEYVNNYQSNCPSGTNTSVCTYHQFRISSQQIPGKINLLAFIKFLQGIGRTQSTLIGSVDLGTEVWQGSGSVEVNSYSLQLGGASSVTTFEGPSSTSTSSTVSPVTTSSSTQTTTSSTATSTSSSLVTSSTSTQKSSSSSTTTSSTSSLVTTSSSTQATTSTTMSSTSATTSSQTTTTSQTTSTLLKNPSVSLNPSSSPAGSTVAVSGSGFSPGDSACSISGSVVSSATCSVTGGILTGSFTVASVASGSYSVTVTGTQAGDSTSASFTVPPSSITLSPTSAQIGTAVDVSGSDFSTTDTSCSLTGSPIGSSSCSISDGTLSGSFNVTSLTPGTYTIKATGSPDDDSASATFVVQGASISFNPASVKGGSNVTVSGSGFSLSDIACTLSGSSVVSQACSVSGGKLTGSITVANVTSNGAVVSFTVTATCNPAGDSASATLLVNGPVLTITMNPPSAPVGGTVQVDGSGFSASDSTCSLSGSPVGTETCSIAGGLVTASFTVAEVTPDEYTVTVKGEPVGDAVSTDFTVTSTSLSIALNPDSGPVGTTVQVSGSIFLSSDSGCTLSGSVVSSPSCSMSNGALSGSFTAANVTAGSYVVTAIGNPNGDIASTTFSVTVPETVQSTTSATSTVATPDFSLVAPSNVAVTQGGTGSDTVSVKSVNGFSASVTLSASWVGTPPVGVSLFTASPVTLLPNGTATIPLTIFASPTATIGTFTVQVEGTSGSMSHILSPNISVQILQAVSTVTSTSGTSSSISSTATSPTETVTTNVTTSAPPLPTSCAVSMATTGTVLDPLAQGLRAFRDQSIMKTRTGAAFMTVFNAWYYSFSPSLASYLGTHRTQRTAFGYALYPLIGLLYVSYYTFALLSPLNNEVAAVAAGLVAASMLGFVYLALPLYVAKRALRRRMSSSSRLNKCLLVLSAASSVTIAFAYFTGMELALGLAAATLLLSTLSLGVTAGIPTLKRVNPAYLGQQLAVLNEVGKTLAIRAMKYLVEISG